MRYAMPNPKLIGTTYYLRIRVPNDIVAAAKGTVVAVRVGDDLVTAKVGEVVKVSLKTKDPTEAKQRFTQALASLDAHWEALKHGPSKLTHKQCVALAGEVRSAWVTILDDEPGDPAMWQRVQTLDAEAKNPKPHPYSALAVGELPAPNNLAGMEERFGGLVDNILRRHCLIVNTETRSRLLPMIAEAMSEAVGVNLRKAQGDYSDSGETDKYPEYQPKPAVSEKPPTRASNALTFSAIIDEEDRRRSIGREGRPSPCETAR